jgi:hypothetical protein
MLLILTPNFDIEKLFNEKFKQVFLTALSDEGIVKILNSTK